MPTQLQPLASATEFVTFGSNRQLVQTPTIWTTTALDSLMARATRRIESMCQRRLAPFSAKFESHEAHGISPTEYGQQGDMAMGLSGALGWSMAQSMGVSDMVREFWLDECAPMYQELWTYSLTSVTLIRTFGDQQTFGPADFVSWQGPEADTGHVKMPIGTYCPQGTTIRVTYGGGYTVSVPDDLVEACILQAMKTVLLSMSPEEERGLSLAELDDEITGLTASYTRG